MTTELESLKIKKRMQKATPEELTRLKVLQDGEPLSAADLENAKKREAKRVTVDKKTYDEKMQTRVSKEDYKMRMSVPVPPHVATVGEGSPIPPGNGAFLDVPATATLDQLPEHPRIAKIKEALLPFTQIEAHDSRPDEFVLFTRGISVTAGDVRKARKAMKI